MYTLLIVGGIVLGALVFSLTGWVWYRFVFKKHWEMLSGGSIPVQQEGETRKQFLARVWPRFLGSVLVALPFSFISLIGVSEAGALFPITLWLLIIVPMLGTNVLWLKERTAKQKWALLGIDAGYFLVAWYVLFLFIFLWGRLAVSVLSPSLM